MFPPGSSRKRSATWAALEPVPGDTLKTLITLIIRLSDAIWTQSRDRVQLNTRCFLLSHRLITRFPLALSQNSVAGGNTQQSLARGCHVSELYPRKAAS